MVNLLYVDSSAFMKLILEEPESLAIEERINAERESGTTVVSSRLLSLECYRVSVRTGLSRDGIMGQLNMIDLLPVDDEVWSQAERIGIHIKSLDAVHVATCSEFGARLLTMDSRMRFVATDWYEIEVVDV